jgi:hypothetical protein
LGGKEDKMSGGKAHGKNRQYQEACRNVLTFRNPKLTPWEGDGIDVPFELPDTQWTFDIALRDDVGALVVAECRRTTGPTKQEDLAAFAYKVELLRKSLGIAVAGIFITKTRHQIGAIKVGQFSGIDLALLDEGAEPPGFKITFLRYDQKREKSYRDIVLHVRPALIAIAGSDINLIFTKRSGEREVS